MSEQRNRLEYVDDGFGNLVVGQDGAPLGGGSTIVHDNLRRTGSIDGVSRPIHEPVGLIDADYQFNESAIGENGENEIIQRGNLGLIELSKKGLSLLAAAVAALLVATIVFSVLTYTVPG